MLKIATCIAASSFASSIYAQSTVQVYGVVDTAVEHLTNVNAAGQSLTRMPNLSGGMLPSRIGFRGSEDLGGGLKAIFVLENGFGPDSGTLNQGGRLFGRQALVGVSGGWGELTAGRTYSMMFLSLFDLDIIGPSQFSIGSIDPYLPNARHDNSIAYKGVFKGLTVGATYSLGRDASSAGGPSATNCGGENATDSRACRNWSAMVRYDGTNWGALAAYDRYNGGTGAAAAFSPTSSALSDSRLNVGGYVKYGSFKVGGGLLSRNNEGSSTSPKSRLAYIGAAYSITPTLVVDGQLARRDVRGSASDTNMYLLRSTYHLSKRTAVYGMVGHIDNDGTAAVALGAGASVAPGGSQNGLIIGIKHAF